jgi:NAD(P)-dependent dehydrogenase (short-subunit alcohol dehydrogenase family)
MPLGRPRGKDREVAVNELIGRAAIVTGANRGLGLSIAAAYLDAGADLCICARDERELLLARDQLQGLATQGQRVVAEVADVSRQSDVKRLVARALQDFPGLSILVNNAGVYGPKGKLEDVSLDEWVRAVEVNLFGSMFMCAALLPHFRRQRYGKIVQLSGGGATAPMPRLSAYAASKAAVVRLVETLAEELKDDGVDVNALAPGALNTRLLQEVIEAGAERVGEAFYAKALAQYAQGGTPLGRGAALAVFLASSASDGITGKLLSAIWDPWEHLAEHLDDLRTSDVYTLRRIVPVERGLHWGSRSD